MLMAISRGKYPGSDRLLNAMFEERKRVFVDLLKWDIPVVADRYEIDQFDDRHALYLIALDEDGRHVASARLLRTDRPHILGSLYPDLCVGPVPCGPSVREITRFCLSRHLNSKGRRTARNRLVTGLAEYALLAGITSYTGVAEIAWLQQILAFGWDCRPLGLPKTHAGSTLGALRIEITHDTIGLLRVGGVYEAAGVTMAPALEPA